MKDNCPPLWNHQAKAVEMSNILGDMGLFFDIGTGKSRTAIEILRYRCAAHGRLLRTLVLAPRIMGTKWRKEIGDYSKINLDNVHVLLDSGKKRVEKFLDKTQDGVGRLTKGGIFITNYEALEMEPLYKALMDWNPEVIICDEAHYIKNHESKRAKLLMHLSDKSLHNYALTGTPILNSALDLFNLFRFIDRGQTFGRNYFKFRSIWFEDQNAGWSGKQGYFPKFEPRPETYSEFSEMIYKKSVRALKSEVLDLPPFVREEIPVEFSPEQKKLYDDMKREFIAYVEEKENDGTPKAVVAQLAVTKALRLQQIATGFAKTEDGEIHKIKNNPRLQALKELLELITPESKVIVWSVFKENYSDIARVCDELKIEYAELHGAIKDRDGQMAKFNGNPRCRVMIANQKAAGIGVDLIASNVSVYYSKNFSWGDDEQSEGRNYRGGSEIHQSVARYDIVTPGTIDELINEALERKEDISKRILDLKDKF